MRGYESRSAVRAPGEGSADQRKHGSRIRGIYRQWIRKIGKGPVRAVIRGLQGAVLIGIGIQDRGLLGDQSQPPDWGGAQSRIFRLPGRSPIGALENSGLSGGIETAAVLRVDNKGRHI